jgi:hypothetical protein
MFRGSVRSTGYPLHSPVSLSLPLPCVAFQLDSTAILVFKSGARSGWMVNKPRRLYPRERDPVSIVLDAGWASGLVWTGVKKRKSLAQAVVHTPTCPSCSDPLYRLRYPGSFCTDTATKLASQTCLHKIVPFSLSLFIYLFIYLLLFTSILGGKLS